MAHQRLAFGDVREETRPMNMRGVRRLRRGSTNHLFICCSRDSYIDLLLIRPGAPGQLAAPQLQHISHISACSSKPEPSAGPPWGRALRERKRATRARSRCACSVAAAARALRAAASG